MIAPIIPAVNAIPPVSLPSITSANGFHSLLQLHGKCLAETAMGELWSLDGRRFLLEFELGGWTITEFPSKSLTLPQSHLIASIDASIAHGLDPSLANAEREHVAGGKKTRFTAYLNDVQADGSRDYQVFDDLPFTTCVRFSQQVVIPADPAEPCRCTCRDFSRNFQEELPSDDDADEDTFYTCVHIDTIDVLDADRSKGKAHRADTFVPCESWN